MHMCHIQSLSKSCACDVHILTPLSYPRRPLDRVVVASNPPRVFLHLYPSPRLHILIHLTIEIGPVRNAPSKPASVDEVKMFLWWERPFGLSVVDVEVAVRRHPRWLDWTEVCTYNDGFRKLLGDFDSPYTSTSTDV